MTRSEWDRIAAVLDNGFPGHFGEAESAAYWLLLGKRPARQVEDAVRRAVDKGLRYRPTPSELVQLIPRARQSHQQAFTATVERYGLEKAREFFPQSEFPLLEEAS